uniref:Calcineurin-like phosphoesterase domain-containing protein n=1 Tax=Mucochytrium quahogii TaxID=96639 RepID=A0A7S2RQX5_9STRA|mmetsp:Transcript_18717/g.40522  ORF Transcript_18717/g.40522 Transcript_18717/m.40522 type:complete len:563 (+) Transcript_18717:387-2075(+)
MKVLHYLLFAAGAQKTFCGLGPKDHSEYEIQWREDFGRQLLAEHGRELWGKELLDKYIRPILMQAYLLEGAWEDVVRLEKEYMKNMSKQAYCNVIGGTVMPYVAAPLAIAGAESILTPKADFPTLDLKTESGVYNLNEPLVVDGKPNFMPREDVAKPIKDKGSIYIAVAADWGAGTLESQQFSNFVIETQPHFSWHLGDIYFAGRPEEIKEKVFKDAGCRTGSQPTTNFESGKFGAFFLNGNHEMLSRGYGYFETLLPAYNQTTSYAAFMSEYWLFTALDSAYDCMPEVTDLTSAMKYLKHVAGNPKMPLNKPQVDWLTDPELNLFDPKNGRGIAVLQHMQMFSVFLDSDFGLKAGMPTDEFKKEAVGESTKFFQKELKKAGYPEGYGIAGLFGHDHKASSYITKLNATSDDMLPITLNSQLLGNGGFESNSPIEKAYYANELGAQWYDNATYKEIPEPNNKPPTPVGYNGWFSLNITGRDLVMDYYRSTPHEKKPWQHAARRTLRVMEDGSGVKEVDTWVDPEIQTTFAPTPYIAPKSQDAMRTSFSLVFMTASLLYTLIM